MTIDEKIKQAANDYSTIGNGAAIEKRKCFTVDLHLGNPQQYEYVKVYNNFSYCAFADGANFVKSEMLADMQKMVEALEFTIEESGTSTNYNHKCRNALAEFNAKYNKGEK